MSYKYPQTIFDAIRSERQDFLYNYIEITPGFTFNQYFNIQKIHKYYNSHYNDGDYETVNGVIRKKVFWNIGKRRATIATKQIDIDTKDFLLISENQATEWNVFLLEKELKAWMTKGKYGKILNQIADELPVYGSCVLRKTKEVAEVLDLRYFFCDQSAESLKKSRYKIIKHFMTPGDLREMKEWSNTQEALDKFATQSVKSYETGGQLNLQHGTPYLEVYERYAEVPRSFLTNEGSLKGDGSKEDEEYVYARFIVAGIDNSMTQALTGDQVAQTVYGPGLILFQEELKLEDDPFKEVHWRKTRGRWQGIGIIEDTFEDQRLVNKNKDQEDKAMELASLILFQTANDMVARNILTDVDNGEILKATAPINRLDNTNKSLAEMQNQANAIELHADRETFSADILGGEKTPASATLGAVKQQVQSSASVFDYKKENFGLFLQEFIEDLVFPDLEKKIMSPHILRFSGDLQEMQKLRQRAVDGYLRAQILKTGDIPDQQTYQALQQQYMRKYLKDSPKMWIAVEKDFFKNLNYEVSLEITGEGKNVQTWLSNLQQVFGIISSNPILMQNPLLKRLLFKMLSAMGMSISELENAEDEVTQEMIDLMIRMSMKREFRQIMNFKDMNQQGQQGMANEANIKLGSQPSQPGPGSENDSTGT